MKGQRMHRGGRGTRGLEGADEHGNRGFKPNVSSGSGAGVETGHLRK